MVQVKLAEFSELVDRYTVDLWLKRVRGFL